MTHNQDIKFGVKSVNNKTGEKTSEVELKRIDTASAKEAGFITCQRNHTCEFIDRKLGFNFTKSIFVLDTVVFDNSYSYFKSKKITYSVVVTTPLTEIEHGANKIEEKIFDQNENDISQVDK